MNYKKLLADLVSMKSLSGEEGEIRGFIKEWFKSRGIESFIQDKNLIVHFKGNNLQKAFIFNSHMDTVGPGSSSWKIDPWIPKINGERLTGLGSSDMKSGVAASMLLAEQISKSGKPPVDMWFTYVVNEEVDGSGTISFSKWFEAQGYIQKYSDMAAIFTEPTDLQLIEHGHRGNYFLEVIASGESGHSSNPDKIQGITAVRKMISFADALYAAVEKWKKQYPSKYFIPSISVGEMTSIRANIKGIFELNDKGKSTINIIPESPNKIADVCIATFDLRTTPETHEVMFPWVEKIGKETGVCVGNLYPPGSAGFTDPSEKIVKIAKDIVKDSIVEVALGSSDLGTLTAKGIKSIIFGPGLKSQMHKPNEYAYPAQIPKAVDMYHKIVETWVK